MDAIGTKALLCAHVGLDHEHSSGIKAPDQVHIVFDDVLLMSIASARVALVSLGIEVAEITVPFNQDAPLYRGGEPWMPEDDAMKYFCASSSWLAVQRDSLCVAYWERYADDELHGTLQLAEVPGLRESIESLQPVVLEQMLTRLR